MNYNVFIEKWNELASAFLVPFVAYFCGVPYNFTTFEDNTPYRAKNG